MNLKLENIESSFLGLAIGDALGVPVEFRNRSALRNSPITTLTGFGAWQQPLGTWSDDSSLTFCLAESLSRRGYDINDIGNSFVKWMRDGYWGAHHEVFDIGGTTRIALQRILEGENPLYSGEFEESSNGNGSLMRIIPASIYFSTLDDNQLLERMREVSGITHRHFRSVLSCFIFSKLTGHLFRGLEKEEAYIKTINEVNEFISSNNFNPEELNLFSRILSGVLLTEFENSIQSSGYVLHTLEASLWCFLNSTSYSEAVLKGVNLGGDTDTTGCVTGALAGLYYGKSQIPTEWIAGLVRRDDIIELAKNFQKCVEKVILAET